MLKKSSILLSSYGGAHNFSSPQVSTSSCHEPRSGRRPCQGRPGNPRSYATVRNSTNDTHEDPNLHWPKLASVHILPTPYQIFNERKGTPYSRRRYFELVKIYHPDKYGHVSCGGLSDAVRLERYRLIVAANDILSDPAKRAAYDRYGAGWNGQPEIRTSTSPSSNNGEEQNSPWAHDGSGGGPRSWHRDPDGPWQNATWEDWEQWRNRDSPHQPKSPIYMSNSAFVSLVVLFAAIGGVGQATRAKTHSMNLAAQADARHAAISEELKKVRGSTLQCDSKGQNIHNFLQQRDPEAYGKNKAQLDAEYGFRRTQ